MPLYKLPLGIKVPADNDYPQGYDVKSINEQRDAANIVEGFIIKEVDGQKYSHYAEVNVDADRIWEVFIKLNNALVSNTAYGIIGFKGEEPTLSGFTGREKINGIFDKYKFELTNDGFIEFGIATSSRDSINEVFVSSFKYMKIWTDRAQTLIDTLNTLGIKHIDNLQFIDEFPVDSEALTPDLVKGIRHYSEIIESIEKEFLSFS